MKIAIIGGGASGMASAYLLDQQGHEVTVFERQAALGGHIQTLNQNLWPNRSNCEQVLENGVLEFPAVFHSFFSLMRMLDVELEPVNIGSALFFKGGRHFLSAGIIRSNFTGIQRLLEYLRLDTLYARSAAFWAKMQLCDLQDFRDRPLSAYLSDENARNTWLKLLTMYSYSMAFERIDNFPAEIAMPVLRRYIFTDWFRIKGGVYSYIQKILERFGGRIVLNADVRVIARAQTNVTILLPEGPQQFDKVVFATPPDQVLKLLASPTAAERQRFGRWQANHIETTLHRDTSLYDPYGIKRPSEFDFFQTDTGWGYNAALNQLCGVTSPQRYSLAFNLSELIDPNQAIHIQTHHTPLYTVEAVRYRNEIVATNGENNTYHAGAYLGDGLHEGAIASAMKVAALIADQSSSTSPLASPATSHSRSPSADQIFAGAYDRPFF
ncbi:FAD dependent oxidoreductase, putative [Synechococcus sp. PCC 7335]|uniref:FAD-dependent oxidoreductase n=1 Tax=Synechococcus sp. (strain ATCC 29403 / PCC 7335) TaxID=91464 RepID=UPI00017ECB57|nr:FAD-dependent oxidoreductase [Synechococcus sp. PCC 7335]EDX83206.1 FAD dependent oxidoreductase, putative [Synechococcus sp. PCC 7335]